MTPQPTIEDHLNRIAELTGEREGVSGKFGWTASRKQAEEGDQLEPNLAWHWGQIKLLAFGEAPKEVEA